jgi:uncharacterized membrane protein
MTGRPWGSRALTLLARPIFWVGVLAAAFFGLSLYGGYSSYANFSDGAYDLSINMQAMWSASHGFHPTFYESADCMVKGRCSFLLVHPAFIGFPIAGLYGALPSPITLFAVQSAAVAGAGIPLYFLAKRVTGSATKGLVATGLYFVWAPTMVGTAFSFHYESFLPLELFSIAALWAAGRYRSGFGVSLITFLTFEAAPIFVFLLAVFFLYPFLRTGVPRALRRIRSDPRDSLRWRAFPTRVRTWLARAWEDRTVRWTVMLGLSSVAAYLLLDLFLNVVGAQLLGAATPPGPGGLSGFFYDNSSPPIQPLGVVLASGQTRFSAEYWLILYALVGFIPLLSPRALILSVPWIGYTLLTVSDRFTSIGPQYTSIAAIPLFIGLAYGLARLPLGGAPAGDTVGGAAAEPASAPSGGPISWHRNPSRYRSVAWGLVGVVVAANLLLSPFSPALHDAGLGLGAPFQPSTFDRSLEIVPGLEYAEQLVQLIPPSATATAPNALFPLIADRSHSYDLEASGNAAYPGGPSKLPVNLTTPPTFVLLDSDLRMAPDALLTLLANTSDYGVRGYVPSTAIGPILLFEYHFSGSPAEFGPSPSNDAAVYTPISGLIPGPSAYVAPNSTAPFGALIRPESYEDPAGLLWSVTPFTLEPGNYSVQADVIPLNTSGFFGSRQPALDIQIDRMGSPLFRANFTPAAFDRTGWTDLLFDLNCSSPIFGFGIDGILIRAGVPIGVGSVNLVPV